MWLQSAPVEGGGGHHCLGSRGSGWWESQLRTYLDCLGRLQRLLRWDAHLPLPQELLGEVGDVTSCDGNVLYTAANNITFSLRETEDTEFMSHNVKRNRDVRVHSCCSLMFSRQCAARPSPCPHSVVFGSFFVHVQQWLQTCWFSHPASKYILQAHFLNLSNSFQPLKHRGLLLNIIVNQLLCKEDRWKYIF